MQVILLKSSCQLIFTILQLQATIFQSDAHKLMSSPIYFRKLVEYLLHHHYAPTNSTSTQVIRAWLIT